MEKSQKLRLKLDSNWEKIVIHLFFLLKNLGEIFSRALCEKLRSKSADFYAKI